MDNNPIQKPVVPADPKPQQPVTQPATNIVQEPPTGNNKMLWVLCCIVVVILLAGGFYWYMTKGQKAAPTTKPQPTPVSQNVDTLEKDLNSTSLDDLDKEFSSVDSDLQGL